jgi:hypothetical protein
MNKIAYLIPVALAGSWWGGDGASQYTTTERREFAVDLLQIYRPMTIDSMIRCGTPPIAIPAASLADGNGSHPTNADNMALADAEFGLL